MSMKGQVSMLPGGSVRRAGLTPYSGEITTSAPILATSAPAIETKQNMVATQPASCATMNPETFYGRMPPKVSRSGPAMVIAGWQMWSKP
jgi:hypothetical protein